MSKEIEAATTEHTGELVYINVDLINPHPDNPRKDLGDLSELAESIKANGILQNLTVVPMTSTASSEGYCPSCALYLPSSPTMCKDDHTDRAPCKHWQDAGRYTVVIGHRRLAAAKLAGVKKLPCMVSNMGRAEQVRTMLMENIQREDLTVYEQAQGFQMMLNLGDSMEDVASKTGFSETTIRRRVKLLELDPKKFKESEARGASLFDYMELDKIKDVKRKNKVLEVIGTENFRSELRKAIDTELAEERKEKWIAALSEFAKQVEDSSGYSQVRWINSNCEPNITRPDDADTVEYFFHIEKYGGITLLRKGAAARIKKDPATVEREKRERELRIQLEEVAKRAYELRKEFADAVTATRAKKHLADILAFDLWVQMDKYCNIDDDEILESLGIELHEAEGDEDEDEELTYDMVLAATVKSPEKVIWRIACCHMDDDSNESYFNWRLEHSENGCLDRFYALLVKMGYQMSDEEKALQDGTHELFHTDPSGEGGKEEDPCALCKSAHPECDKCCATCEEPCNSSQACRKQTED